MPNVVGPKQSKRLLLSSVVSSVLTYRISIWSDALGIQEAWRKAAPVYRLSALRVVSAFRTISKEALCVISGILPLRVLAEKRQTLYQRTRSSTRKNGRIVYANGSYSGMLERRMLSGYGCFRAYLHRFKRDDSPECPSCPGKPEDAEHVFFVCPRFNL
ncbi:hypothetical protein EVAR_57985_1 [Eumeta japonica]|uniref:Retrovirus-related Pol polyprotein from type-1 retrotransposable element R1 4 n=1 Tax=Eumeta variegata TaxID=151549 RepID=A0A4C1XVP9_EUMVA|nr:hypothetical protein EVAR_57985_1 [Eumeta japonica]